MHIMSKILNTSFFESRLEFDEIKDEPQAKGRKNGIRCHSSIAAFFLRLFCKNPIKLQLNIDGKQTYIWVNRNSLKGWLYNHHQNIDGYAKWQAKDWQAKVERCIAEVKKSLPVPPAEKNVAKEEFSSLYNAVLDNDPKKVEKLLAEDESQVDKSEQVDTTPLTIAAAKGYLPIVQVLLKHHANVNGGVVENQSPLWWAVGGNDLSNGRVVQIQYEVVHCLLEAGANLNISVPSILVTIAHQCQQDEKARELFKLLVEKGAKFNNGLIERRLLEALPQETRDFIHSCGVKPPAKS